MNVIGVVSMVVVMVGFATPSHSGTYSNEIQQLSLNIADRIVRSGVRTVAVADFTDLQGNITELGRFLAEHFSVALAGAGRAIEVIDRTHIKTLLREHKLSETLDTTTAKQLWKIAGVEALVTGTLTPFGDTVEISLKVLDTGNAKIIDARTESLAKTKTIQELLEREVITEGTTSTRLNTKSPSISTLTKVELKGFTFAVQSCNKSGDSVTCHVLITSQGQDKELTLCIHYPGYRCYQGARIIDNLGNEYTVKQIQIGSESSDRALDHTFPKDIPIKTIFNFEGIVPQASQIALFEINCRDFPVQLPNIPLN